jgi:hypothetical protein
VYFEEAQIDTFVSTRRRAESAKFALERKFKEATNGSASRLGHGNATGKRGNSMTNSKTNARTTGILFILGTVPVIIAMLSFGQHLSAPDILSAVAANRTHTLLLALAIMVMGISCAGIGISLHSVLKQHNEGLARAVMGLRLMEGTLQVASALGFFALVAVGQEFVKAGSPPDSLFQAIGAAIKTMNDWVSNIYGLPFGIAAFIYYAIFYGTRLLPRWLSVWGLVGISLMIVSVLSGLLSLMDPSSPVLFLFNMPILVQELVLAVWLIVKGYASPAAVKVMA